MATNHAACKWLHTPTVTSTVKSSSTCSTVKLVPHCKSELLGSVTLVTMTPLTAGVECRLLRLSNHELQRFAAYLEHMATPTHLVLREMTMHRPS